MKWVDNLTLEGDPEDMRERAQWQFTMCALHLSCGHSIFCRQIRAATIKQYIQAASSFIKLFVGHDYWKDNDKDQHLGSTLRSVLQDIKKYESIPNRREPYDMRMHQLARSLASSAACDSLVSALIDGFEQGLCCGYGLSEWAQPSCRSNVTKPQLNHLVSSSIWTRAIVPSDIWCLTTTHAHVRGLGVASLSPTSIARLWIRWRTQKNGQHGEEKVFVPNPTLGGVCCV